MGQGRCGKWMPRKKTTCARTPGHGGPCKTAETMERNRLYNRDHPHRESPESRKKSNRKYSERWDRWHNPARSIQAVRSVSTQLTSHRSTNGQVIDSLSGWQQDICRKVRTHPRHPPTSGRSVGTIRC
jgi:hypothetical protein